MKKIEAISSGEAKNMSTDQLRDNFLLEDIFKKDQITFNYSYYDRIIVGGVMPVTKKLSLKLDKELGVEFFLQRREIGLINIGGDGKINIDGKEYKINKLDGIYIGVGNKKIELKSNDKNNPSRFYFMSTTGNKEYPITIINKEKAQPLHMGELSNLNKRTIYQYFHPNTCKTNQLLMGMTILEEGNVWNTMPPHTHERRMEAYFYFNMDKESRVFHFHGKPQETRHIIVGNESVIISPSWSIHGGVSTGKYSFIWAMAGENQTFSDMQKIEIKNLK